LAASPNSTKKSLQLGTPTIIGGARTVATRFGGKSAIERQPAASAVYGRAANPISAECGLGSPKSSGIRHLNCRLLPLPGGMDASLTPTL
jgi:hypothetical protein